MTVNEFNAKISLPAYCDGLGIKGYDYVKVPRFGWFAFTKDYSEVLSLCDMIGKRDFTKDVTYIIKEKKEYHEFSIMYTERGVIKLTNDFKNLIQVDKFYKACVGAFYEQQVNYQSSPVIMDEELKRQGMPLFHKAGLGVITKEIFDEYSSIFNLGNKYLNKVIIPSFHTPKHFCSLEAIDIDDTKKTQRIYYNLEKGWYGRVNTDIIQSVNNLKFVEGATWDKKLDLWSSKVIDIDIAVDPGLCLKIWVEANNTMFRDSPLRVIEQAGKAGMLKYHLKDLSYAQVKLLERRFGNDLLSIWKQQTTEEIQIGNLKFITKDGQYYIQQGERIDELTNFTVKVLKIVKKGDTFFRHGYITYNENDYPFEFDNKYFLSVKGFMKNIHNFFFQQGIGMPIFYTAYQSYILEVVNKSCRDIPIESNLTRLPS